MDMAKRISLYKFNVDVAAASLTLLTSAGEKFEPFGTITVSGIDNERDRMACLHGYKQKIADKGAKSADEGTGKVDPAERLAAVTAEFVRIRDGGDWNAASAGPGLGVDGNLLVDAFALAYPDRERSEIVEKIKGWDAATRAAFLTRDTPMSPFIEQVREQRAKHVDTDKALAALGFDAGSEEAGE
jgi:hypothetical protein